MTGSGPGAGSVGQLRLAVPCYVHPSEDPDVWRRLVAAAPVLRLVVVNPHSGPGEHLDPAYPPVVAGLRAAGVRLAGYVDTAYGQRSPADVAAEVATYVSRFGVTGVFLDQVGTGIEQLEHYAQVTRLCRAAGARFVAFNPGAHPHPGYVDLANLVLTFEGPYDAWQSLEVPDWVRRFPAKRFGHLVHGIAPAELARSVERAGQHHIGAVMLTDGSGSNPWDRLPPAVPDALRRPAGPPDRAPVVVPVASAAPSSGSLPRIAPLSRQPPWSRGWPAAAPVVLAAVLLAMLLLAATARLPAGLGRAALLAGAAVLLCAWLAGGSFRGTLARRLGHPGVLAVGILYVTSGILGAALAPVTAVALFAVALAGVGAGFLSPSPH